MELVKYDSMAVG
jgi:ATP-binding cassette, subfamily C (CFTR/MRP), member 1